MRTRGIRLAVLTAYMTLATACVAVPQRSNMNEAQQVPPAEIGAGTTFTVTSDPLPESVYYVEEPEVLVPVVIGQPVYYSPPMVVTYAYDYFTYEQVGVFVNVVFWKDGRRQRSEVWYDRGRRMTVKRMRAQGYAHKVRHSEWQRHRDLLERNNHTRHSGAPHQERRDDRRHRDDRGRNHKDEKVTQVPQPRQQNTLPPARNGLLRATLPQERPTTPPPQQQTPSRREKRVSSKPVAETPKQTPAPQPAQQGDQPPKNIFGVRNK